MHTSIKLSVILILIAFNGVFAQPTLPVVYELHTDTAAVSKLDGNYSQLLEDPQDSFTIEQVASPAFNTRFHANQTAIIGISRNVHTYWFRFRIRNLLERDVEIYFDNQLQYLEVYTPVTNGQWYRQQTGVLVPWSKRNGLKYAQKLPIILKKGQQTEVYQRVQTFRRRLTEIPPPSFSVKEQFLEDFYTGMAEQDGIGSFLINGMIIGILLIAALYNFVVFMQMQEKVYLYCSLWILFNCIIRFEYLIQIPPVAEYHYVIFKVLSYLSIITAIFLVQFIRSFLQTRRKVPVWDKALIITLGWYVVCMVLFEFLIEEPISFLDKLSAIITFALSLIYILAGILMFQLMRRGNYWAGFLLIAMIPRILFVGIGNGINAIVLFITSSEVIPPTIIDNLQKITFIWMVVIFSGALIRRYSHARKEIAQKELEKEIEKSQLIEAQKVELEKQVAQRTAEVVAQKEAITQQKEELQSTLEHLKATQNQLVQSEKMASLGELTAGIAHEIQNPLNFVNNFSEVSSELVEELKQEASNPQEVLAIADDLTQNLTKIYHHGKRADAIVKSMLQHSRSSSGEKQLTDINALADEYLRLAYHGFRTKNKDFNADFNLEADPNLDKMEVVPQEIGRVLLNLFNNAFYATAQKEAQLNGQYQPQVIVTTKATEDKVEIRVRDNGTGIPESVKQKIFQPFFTTKPTGEGTGLGLSLSYDIITKGHGGELTVNSKEREGSEFIIILPNHYF